MAKTSLCPPPPAHVPEGLTAPTSLYKMQTFMVLLALGLFFLLYFGLMFFCVLSSFWAVFLSPIAYRAVALFLTFPLGGLFLYLLKNLFKFERADNEFRLKLYENEHPQLFQFIKQVCAEAGAPVPNHVYVDYSVNACAMPDRISIFHLFLPAGKSLTIGLGLVNSVNLTEFKAMLAHELGHFSQKSTKVSTYVFAMHRIFARVVNSEDIFDRFIVGWTRLNHVFALPGYLMYAWLWMFRKVVGLMWLVVECLFLSLRRQQEFNADLVAVSVTGSDAPVHLLYRCYFADTSFTQAVNDLRVAMDHHLCTSDLFYHQSAACRFLRKKNKDPRLGEPPELPDDSAETTQVFHQDDDRIAQLGESHPSPYDREQNAKACYIRTAFDERSPWLLFDNAAELRKRVTYKFYRWYWNMPKNVILADPEEVQTFIDEEHADRTLESRYEGLYDCRNILLSCMTYIPMALHIDMDVAEDLYRRYQFHLELQGIWHEIQKRHSPVQNAIAYLNSLSPAEYATTLHRRDLRDLIDIFRDTHKAMRLMLHQAEHMTLPALKNLPAGQPLQPFLLKKRLIDGVGKYEHRISERWIVKLLAQFNEMKCKVDRIRFKSLAGILALQERIGEEKENITHAPFGNFCVRPASQEMMHKGLSG